MLHVGVTSASVKVLIYLLLSFLLNESRYRELVSEIRSAKYKKYSVVLTLCMHGQRFENRLNFSTLLSIK